MGNSSLVVVNDVGYRERHELRLSILNREIHNGVYTIIHRHKTEVSTCACI